ncbi:hypothetical protein OHT52_03035 [Streptomyces sp. NBC_00247]|uniref:hypothetical protein n=1 Tax=Streptomyces sp. NBC_00247 TaxID=2975689 RepID=UPI002E2AE758|nr:hypothetical protein [Streptomyces sp. NBC_00247]
MTLWEATGPRTQEAREGAFTVGSARSFATERKPLARALPNMYYVLARYTPEAFGSTSEEGAVDLGRLRSATLGPDEYMTHRSEVMTETQIRAQYPCAEASATPSL